MISFSRGRCVEFSMFWRWRFETREFCFPGASSEACWMRRMRANVPWKRGRQRNYLVYDLDGSGWIFGFETEGSRGNGIENGSEKEVDKCDQK
jgi:hypothetical protein